MSLSIIIPTLNEEAALPATLRSVAALSPAPLEVIVADSGSDDRTVEIARAFGATVITDLPRGRAGQMNAGAKLAKGDQLCFLHADTEVPADFVDLAERVLSDPNVALAGCISIMRGTTGVRRVTTAHNFIKTWYAPLLFRPISFFRGTRLLFGDQVMICRSNDFKAVGGWDPDQKIMEEADMCLRAAKMGYRPMITPEAQIMHLVGAAAGQRSGKWESVARARTTLIRDHLPTWQVPLGLALMWTWAAIRRGLTALRPGEKTEIYAHVWAERKVWLKGY